MKLKTNKQDREKAKKGTEKKAKKGTEQKAKKGTEQKEEGIIQTVQLLLPKDPEHTR